MDFELTEEGRPIAIAVDAPRADSAGIPAIAQADRQDVFSLTQQRRGIEGLVLNPRVIVGPAGCQAFLADARAVDKRLVHAQRGDVQASPLRNS